MNLIPVKQFMNTPGERHAFVIGFCEVLCPLPPRHPINSTNPINSEYHYYSTGRALALLIWLGIAKLIQVVFF